MLVFTEFYDKLKICDNSALDYLNDWSFVMNLYHPKGFQQCSH